MSVEERIGALSGVELPEDFGTTTSWRRARDEDTSLSRVTRAEWMVRVGDGNLHRVEFALEEGHMLGECDCRGYRHRDWCAHLAALVLAYVRDEIEPADLAIPVEDEVDALWARTGRDGGEA